MDVYFIPGLGANCKVFDDIELPEGFNRHYIEWLMPETNESLESYTLRMAEKIDLSSDFILVGYSFGGIIVQEMNKFLIPQKNILISTIKSKTEIPLLFRFGKRMEFADRFKMWSVIENKVFRDWAARFMYDLTPEQTEKYLTRTSTRYLHWSVKQILEWEPTIKCKNVYHIHGSKDQVFPVKNIRHAFTVENGHHLMLITMSRKVSLIIQQILTESIEQ